MKPHLLTTIAAVVLVGSVLADPIHDAAWGGDLAGVQAELDKGTDVNAKDALGTPLHYAADLGHKEIVKLLIANDADVSAKTKWGQPPMQNAAPSGHKEIVELLIAKGADVNDADDGGWTPLHEAVDRGHKEIAELLIAEDADVNAKDEDGITPLLRALSGQKEIVELLITKGADVNAKDDKGRTPLDRAVGYTETVTLLREHGGKTAEELALMPHLEYGKDQRPFGFSFTAEDEKNYVVEVTQDFKQWGKLETIKGTGKQVKFIDPRQPLVPFKRNFYRVKLVE